MDRIKPEDRFKKEYKEHRIFHRIDVYVRFYDSLSFAIMGFLSLGTKAWINIDTYSLSSMKGTLESISLILKTGRINDAYALLRKYYDSTLINLYANLYLEQNFDIENMVVQQIEKWRTGEESIPGFRTISNYIVQSDKLKPITALLRSDKTYTLIRERCNDHTHYNFYRNVLLNDNEIYNPNRVEYLNQFYLDLNNLFIQHISYLFFFKEHYMMSSDYSDYMDVGETPPEGAENWVAPFVQDIFNDIIKLEKPEIWEVIKRNTSMQID